MFVVSAVVRVVMGVAAAFMLGYVAFLLWSVSLPPFAGLSIQTFTVVNSMAGGVVLGTGVAWYKWDAATEWRPRLIMLGLITVGAFAGGWIGYDYGFDKGIENLKAQYSGRIPGGEIRFPTHDGIRASLNFGVLSANGLAATYHVWRILRYNDSSDL